MRHGGRLLVYFHQRTLGPAIVEQDYIVYQFSNLTGELLARKSHWRDEVPDVLPELCVSEAEACAMVPGTVRFADLFLISPQSNVFPFDPAPKNPSWAVRSIDTRGHHVVTVIDARSGITLGNGAAPPSSGFTLSGPQFFEPCSGIWGDWYENAEDWFTTMGYCTHGLAWPTEDKLRSQIQSNQTAVFYELAHGSSEVFAGGCVDGEDAEYTTAWEISAWIADYEKMPFAFIGSCGGMCETAPGSFAYEFRKGSSNNTAVVGYCGMGDDKCNTCWTYSVLWQDTLFDLMNQGYTVKEAFDQANADYPACASVACMRFAGDEDFAVVPPVLRSSCIADLNGDNFVSVPDLLKVLSNWGDCPTCPADITGDGVVNVLDVLEVLLAWGPC